MSRLPRQRTRGCSDPHQWTAEVALGGGQTDAAAAHTLRTVLGVAANPWQIARILAESARLESRRRLINWLAAQRTPRR